MIAQETIDKINDAVRIEEVLGDFISLKRRGANYLACCPFHNEKTPSFTVSPTKGFYYCFGCKKGGNAVTFLREHENMSYMEAMEYLAKKYHIEIENRGELSAEEIAARQKSESLHIVTDFAQNFFVSQLESGEGRAVGYQYFKSRGLEDETIRKFGLGWCPSGKHSLLDAARAEGFKDEFLVDTGLEVKLEDGTMYDRFHERAIFPIHSVSGRVIGFGGRTLKDHKALGLGKYVNSPESEIYNKRKTLYGLWQAKSQIAKEDKCILTEGYLDVISMHQLGLTNVVASSGTSLTEEQVALIRRFTPNVTIIYDGDWAGIHAAIRGIGLVLEGGLNVKVVLLPDGMDPDDFAKSHTLEEVRNFISENEKDFISFKTDLMMQEAAGDPLKTADIINEIILTIALIPDPVKRAVYADALSKRFELDKNMVLGQIGAGHEKSLEARSREQEAVRRQNQRQEQIRRSVSVPGADMTVLRPASEPQKRGEDLLLEPIEKGIIDFIINYGDKLLTFDPDSDYFVEKPETVATFINNFFSENSITMSNPLLQGVYDKYFSLIGTGLSQDETVRRIVAEDGIGPVAVQATMSRESIASGLPSNETPMLLREVPQALLLYYLRRLDKRLADIREAIRSGESDAMKLLMETREINETRQIINKKIGRI
ncbi:MAG: DNA primase [Bacteroidales bacterium]|nr:DNA primase [Bacteroidales bacterium]